VSAPERRTEPAAHAALIFVGHREDLGRHEKKEIP
jgi:hypothetical protein